MISIFNYISSNKLFEHSFTYGMPLGNIGTNYFMVVFWVERDVNTFDLLFECMFIVIFLP